MTEEVAAPGYETGHEKLIEKFCCSTWQPKLPKAEITRQLCMTDNIDPANLLIVGNGRSKIAAAAGLGGNRLEPP